jgi:hypothetical protein
MTVENKYGEEIVRRARQGSAGGAAIGGLLGLVAGALGGGGVGAWPGAMAGGKAGSLAGLAGGAVIGVLTGREYSGAADLRAAAVCKCVGKTWTVEDATTELVNVAQSSGHWVKVR